MGGGKVRETQLEPQPETDIDALVDVGVSGDVSDLSPPPPPPPPPSKPDIDGGFTRLLSDQVNTLEESGRLEVKKIHSQFGLITICGVLILVLGIVVSEIQSKRLVAHQDQIAQLVSKHEREQASVTDILAQQHTRIGELEFAQNRAEGRVGRLLLGAEMAKQRVTVKQGEVDVEYFVFGGHAYRFMNTCMTGAEAWSLSRSDKASVALPGYKSTHGYLATMETEDEYDFLAKLATWYAIQGAPWCWYGDNPSPASPTRKLALTGWGYDDDVFFDYLETPPYRAVTEPTNEPIKMELPWLVRMWMGGSDIIEEGDWRWRYFAEPNSVASVNNKGRTAISGIKKSGGGGGGRSPGFSKWLREEPNDNGLGEDCMVFEGTEKYSQVVRKHRDSFGPLPPIATNVPTAHDEILLGWNDVPCQDVSAPALLKFDLIPKMPK